MAHEQHRGIADAAVTAKAQRRGVDQTDVSKSLKQQADAIQGSGQADAATGRFPELNQPHLVLASAAGLAATTVGSIHLQAGEHIAVTSEGHLSLSVGRRLLASAKDGIRLFALKGGMKWIAGKDKITIEAHKDKINVTARQSVTIKSTSESIVISAPTKVVVNGGGSFTEWSNAGILHGTLGRWIEHAAKGLLTLEQSARFSWLTPAFAAFAGGHHAALSAAAFLLLRGNPEKAGTYLKRLPQLSLANQTVLHAIEGAQVRGELNMPVLVRRSLSAEEAVKRMRGSPSGTYSDGDIRAASKNAKSASPKRIEVLELSDVNTETGAVTPRAGEGPRMPGHAPGARSTKAFEALQERAKSLGAPEMDQRSLSRVTNYRGAEAANLLSEGKIDRWLGIGGMVVQGIGLWQSVPTLFKQLTQETTDPAGLRDAALGVGDGVAGFTGAAADTLAGAHKLALMRQATGKHLVEVSTRLATLKTVAALAGVAGGVLNAVMSAYKAEGAKDKGDELSMWGYYAAMAAFGTSVLPSGYVAIDAASRQAVSRFIARRVLLRAAGVVTAEALTASAGAVAAFVSGVGLVLLIVGIGATVIAIAGTRDSLERWAARSYFGKGNTGNERPFENQKEEDEGLDQALNPSAAPAAPPAPIYRPGGNFGIYG